LTDISGPFYRTDKPFRNWSSFPFTQIDQEEAPYIDHEQLAWGVERAHTYLEEVHQQGYTGIVIDNMAHLVTFDHAPKPIYAAESPFRLRALAYQSAFASLFQRAVQLGMEIFVTTDMQWMTPPIEQFVKTVAATNRRLAQVNQWALEELLTTFPEITGVVVRVGEAGGSHNHGGYDGHMIYTDAPRLRGLLKTLLPVCERYNRLLILRTWSIGIGEVGDMMWSRERYLEVFGDQRSPNLLVSIKHTPTDFYRFLPDNPTLGLSGPRQIIEFQNRREYEFFGMVPNSVADLHQRVLQHEHAHNPRFAGIWAWNSSGGWGGGRAALGADGWSVWTRLNSALTATIYHTPSCDATAWVHQWCQQWCQQWSQQAIGDTYGEPFGRAMADLYLDSASIIEDGWYLGSLPYGEQAVGATYLPSLLWVWWMRPTASPLIWSYLSLAVENRRQVIENGERACRTLSLHARNLAAVAPPDNPAAAAVVESVRYFADSVLAAHTIRSFFLRLYEAVSEDTYTGWREVARQADDVRAALEQYRGAWEGNLDYPPLELDEIIAFLTSLSKHPRLLWLEARITASLVSYLRRGHSFVPIWRVLGLSAATLLAYTLFSRKHRNVGFVSIAVSIVVASVVALMAASPLRQRILRGMAPVISLIPWASQRLFLLPSIFFEAGPSLSEWLE
jgi:hypothetical protein